MAYQLVAPLVKELALTKIDPSGDTKVKIRQATRADHDQRTDLSAEATRIFNDADVGEVQVKQRLSLADLHRLEVFMTLADCNILAQDGQPLFKFAERNGYSRVAMSQTEFALAWGKLPIEVADEIHEQVLKVNVKWGGEAGEN